MQYVTPDYLERRADELEAEGRIPLTSSNVDSGYWDFKDNILYIWFRGKGKEQATDTRLYAYIGINPVDASRFFTGGGGGLTSHGLFVANILKPMFSVKGTSPGQFYEIGMRGPPIETYRPDEPGVIRW